MSKISLFKNVAMCENPEHMDILDYLDRTREGEWQDIVLECRNLPTKEARDAMKRKMPTATLSGTFTRRDDSSLKVHSEYLAMDVDDVEDPEKIKGILKKDKYVFSCFVSTGGRGLRVLFKIDPTKQRESFLGISDYLWTHYEIDVDPNSHLAKPYVVSYDPHLYLANHQVPVFKKYIKETPIKQIGDFVHTAGDFRSILEQIVGRGTDICPSYHDWIRIGFALAEQFGEDGRAYYHQISQFNEKYRVIRTDKQYTACLKGSGAKKANISTFYYLAKINGINICSEQTKVIVRTTKNGKKAGLSKKQIAENLDKFSNIQGADEIIEKIFDSPNQSDDDEGDSLLPQLEMFISNNYNLVMNDVTGFLEQNGKQITPSELNSIFIAAKKLFPKLDYQLMLRLLKSDYIEVYNPFFKFFNSDGIPVILPANPVDNNENFESPLLDLLASTIKNDKPAFTKYFLKKWMVGVVSSAHKIHSPLLLCLLGPQGTGKTEFFRRLLPPELLPYYAESKLDREKDDEILMCENLIIMDDELGGKSKQDAQKLKNITSKQWFSLRRPYGEHNEKILRLAVLCGTSNYNEVLYDPTGNRRIIPIEVYAIDKELFNSINKRDLFMEAFDLYKKGFEWRINNGDLAFLNQDQEKYESVIRERELIQKYYLSEDVDRMSTTEILIEIENITKQKLNVNILGRQLKDLGFVSKTTRDGPFSTPKKWCVKKINRFENLNFEP